MKNFIKRAWPFIVTVLALFVVLAVMIIGSFRHYANTMQLSYSEQLQEAMGHPAEDEVDETVDESASYQVDEVDNESSTETSVTPETQAPKQSQSTTEIISPDIPVESEKPWLRIKDNKLDSFPSATEAFDRVYELKEETSDVYTLNLLVSGVSLKSVDVSGNPIIINDYELYSGKTSCSFKDNGENLYTIQFQVIPIRNKYLFKFQTTNGTIFYTAVQISF